MKKIKVAIIGSGNIGTDLMIKIERLSDRLEVAAMIGIDPKSDGLKRAKRLGKATSYEGVDGLVALPEFDEIFIIFDATSAAAHQHHNAVLQKHGKQVIDLTPAAIGPFVVPSVNLEANLNAANINMVTCGGQATIPIVAAINSASKVHDGEVIA
ncbi:MAG: Gfo/Idh/MocA family oxidoreductase, partial [Proteobacteria bacterium]|nr:Gfo/Idh/MocA family oxidoreductase [Pseudomonadota bacterium]